MEATEGEVRISFSKAIGISGPYYICVISRMYWQKMAKKVDPIIVMAEMGKTLSLKYPSAPLPGTKKPALKRLKY